MGVFICVMIYSVWGVGLSLFYTGKRQMSNRRVKPQDGLQYSEFESHRQGEVSAFRYSIRPPSGVLAIKDRLGTARPK